MVTPGRQLHLYRLPDRDRGDQDLADTTCLREDQWRTVPKAVNKALRSLSYSWPRRTEVYPNLDIGKRTSKHTTTTSKGPLTKRTNAPRLQTISEEQQQASYPPDQSDDDELPDGDDDATRDPPAPEDVDPGPDQLEEDDFDVDQRGDSDVEIPDENQEPTQEKKRDLEFAHDNSGHPSRAEFARLLRRGSVDPKVVRWVKMHFSCETCEANKLPSSRRPVAILRSYRVNHVVGIDLIYVERQSSGSTVFAGDPTSNW